MSEPLAVDADIAFNTGQSVMAQAVELREELDRLGEEWDELSQEWAGGAATAYGAAWQDWHEGAVTLVGSLLEVSENLCRGAVLYDQRDADAAQATQAAGASIET